MSFKLRNLLIGAGVAAAGGIGTKMAVDYFKNRDKEEDVEGPPVTEQSEEEAVEQAPAGALSAEEVAYVNVEPSSVQDFLDRSFGSPGRYAPTRAPKVFEYQDQQYMVIWAYDNEKEKNQMLAFIYKDDGRHMIASVGYTADATDYNINLEDTPLAVEVNGEQIKSGQDSTDGAEEVDLVVAA
jgi:ferredoxin